MVSKKYIILIGIYKEKRYISTSSRLFIQNCYTKITFRNWTDSLIKLSIIEYEQLETYCFKVIKRNSKNEWNSKLRYFLQFAEFKLILCVCFLEPILGMETEKNRKI